jgi:hypothetical protein
MATLCVRYDFTSNVRTASATLQDRKRSKRHSIHKGDRRRRKGVRRFAEINPRYIDQQLNCPSEPHELASTSIAQSSGQQQNDMILGYELDPFGTNDSGGTSTQVPV